MATYDKEIDYINSKVYLKLKDRSIYGSSRVGVRSTEIDMLALHNPNYSMKSVKYEIGKRTYELSNHLGNVLSVISDKPIPSFEGGNLVGMLADVRVAQDYSPFGVTLSGRSFEVDGGYRYSFQGQEHDDEIKGSGNWYTFGDYGYDPRIVQRPSPDPKAHEYPFQSPYSVFNGNPIYFNDPTGESGEATIDKKSKTITVRQHLIFHGNKAETKLSNKIATGIASQWNSANGKVTIDGVEYKVKFRVSYQTVTTDEAKKMAASNTDIKNNFIQVDDLGTKSSAFQLGGNAGYFNTQDDIGGSTTPAHEIGHGLGLDHEKGGQTKGDRPDIMTARKTTVHPRWSKVGPSNEIDPNFRQVNQKNISDVFKGVKFDKSGKANIGKTTNTIYNEKKDEK